MDEQTRDKLKEELAELDHAEQQIREARKPFDAALLAVETVRENLREKHDVEIAGDCEGCGRLLFSGEPGFRCEDGEVLCEKCAPTFGDAESQWKDDPADDEPERRKAFMDSLTAHLAAGGSRSDKLPLAAL